MVPLKHLPALPSLDNVHWGGGAPPRPEKEWQKDIHLTRGPERAAKTNYDVNVINFSINWNMATQFVMLEKKKTIK